MAEFDELLTVKAAAQECGHSMGTVRRWIAEGKLPAHKLGNQFLVRRHDLMRTCPKLREREKAKQLAALEDIWAMGDRIYQRVGHIDILDALDRSRESHP